MLQAKKSLKFRQSFSYPVKQGALLLLCVVFLPTWLNRIPLSALAAILIVAGIKLAKPRLFRQMWQEGPNQFLPFIVTVLAILFRLLLAFM